MDHLQIPPEVIEKQFTPVDQNAQAAADKAAADKAAAEAAQGGGKTEEQLAEEKKAQELAASGGQGGGDDDPPDMSLLTAADTTLVTDLETLLQKEDGTLTEEEEKRIEDNLPLVKAIANKEVPFVQKLMVEENLLESGEFEDTYEGRTAYLKERDKVRDKVSLENFFAENAVLKQFKEHVVDNKLPVATFMAQVNRPQVLDVKLVAPTEGMNESEIAAIDNINEKVVRANLQTTGVDATTTEAIISGAKTAGTLANMAKASQANMQGIYDKRVAEVNDKAIAERAAYKKQQEDEEKELVSLIRSNRLTDQFTIPKTDEVSFLQYATTHINDRGQTMADIKYEKLTLGQRAALDYIVFKDMKLPSVARTNVLARFKSGNTQNQKRQSQQVKPASNRHFSLQDFAKMAQEQSKM